MDVLDRLQQTVAVTGPRVVTAAHPAAAAAGAAAFGQGGNAFDAALAACFVETVALPMKCGLAGDVVALFRRAGEPVKALVSVGPGPQALAEGATLERVGPRSVGVPGAPHGYATLHEFARLGLERLVAPAVRAAEDGVPWNWIALGYLIEAEELLARVSPNNPYNPGGCRPQMGELRRLPGLGALLRIFAERGADLFGGREGEILVEAVQKRGGMLAMEDLRSRPAGVVPAAAAELAPGVRLLTTPSPTGGPRLAELLRRSKPHDDTLPAIVSAERVEAKARGRLAVDGGTSVVTAADEEGNVVVVVHSNSFPRFGSGVVLESGLVLSNRPGRGFDLTAPAGARNAAAAGRIPETTLHAWALERPGELLAGATPGGINQLPWNVQTVRELLDGATPAAAVTNPRFALDDKDELSAEEGTRIAPSIEIDRRLPRFAHRSVQQVLRLVPGAPIEAAADPRSGAVALPVY